MRVRPSVIFVLALTIGVFIAGWVRSRDRAPSEKIKILNANESYQFQ